MGSAALEVPIAPPRRRRTPILTLAVRNDDDTVILLVAGEIDVLTTPQLGKALDEALHGKPEVLVVDLSPVAFLDSSGLQALLSAHHDAGTHTQLRIVADARATLRPIRLTGLDLHLRVYPTRREALA